MLDQRVTDARTATTTVAAFAATLRVAAACWVVAVRQMNGMDMGPATELTPVKRHFRRRCRANVCSGFEFGLCCVGSSIGLMLMLVALGVMSVTWMAVIAVVVLAQKLLPGNAVVDVPLALAIVGLGIWIVIAPASVPGLVQPM